MPSLILFSSLTGASVVGASAMAPVILGAGADCFTLPTVSFGRHPGHGAPGGLTLDDHAFNTQLQTALSHPTTREASIWVTGYFASPAQVQAVADAFAAITPDARPVLLVDPVMGDHDSGAYVSEAVIDALKTRLVPLAHAVCLNSWEAARLTGIEGRTPEDGAAQAAALKRLAVISSLAAQPEEIGVLVARDETAEFASTARRDHHLHGLGDVLTALTALALTFAPARPIDPSSLVAAMDSAIDDARHGELRPARLNALGWAFANAL